MSNTTSNNNLPKTKIQNGISYTLHGDYYLPNFALPTEKEGSSFGMYGRMRLRYIKEYRPIVYSQLLTSCKLNKHLHDIDVQCSEMIEQVVEKLAKQYGVDEKLKAEKQMLWVGYMNTFKEQAREIAINEIIYK